MIIHGMQGLGDNVYQRAFVKALKGDIYLMTAWPELYKDLPNVQFLNPNTSLRTQARNAHRFGEYTKAPYSDRHHVQVSYGDVGIMAGMSRAFGCSPGSFDLPDMGDCPINPPRPYIVVRPATVRKEWRADSRNPRGDYIAKAAQAAIDAGYFVVSVADVDGQNEWLSGDEPPAHLKFHRGEFGVESLLALTQNAAGIIGGVGWAYPVAIAQQVPMLCFFGGYGHYNHPSKLQPIGGNMSGMTLAVPDNMCLCNNGRHQCPSKDISNVERVISGYLEKLRPADMVA